MFKIEQEKMFALPFFFFFLCLKMFAILKTKVNDQYFQFKVQILAHLSNIVIKCLINHRCLLF